MAPTKRPRTSHPSVNEPSYTNLANLPAPSRTNTVPSAPSNANEYLSTLPSDFRTSKRDKRTIRHDALLAKVRDAGITKTTGKQKRRRPAKKLSTGLGELEDALPDVGAASFASNADRAYGSQDDEWEGLSSADEAHAGGMDLEAMGLRKPPGRRRNRKEGKMEMKSLKHRPGAMKRRAKMEQGERERFARNLARMVGSGQTKSRQTRKGDGSVEGRSGSLGANGGGASQGDRWAALRRFIGSTLDRSAAFSGSSGSGAAAIAAVSSV